MLFEDNIDKWKKTMPVATPQVEDDGTECHKWKMMAQNWQMDTIRGVNFKESTQGRRVDTASMADGVMRAWLVSTSCTTH